MTARELRNINAILKIAMGTHYHVPYGSKTTPVFLPAADDASWLLIPSLVFILGTTTL